MFRREAAGAEKMLPHLILLTAGGGRPSFARRVVMFGRRAFDSFRFQRSGAKGPVPSEYALERPHTR